MSRPGCRVLLGRPTCAVPVIAIADDGPRAPITKGRMDIRSALCVHSDGRMRAVHALQVTELYKSSTCSSGCARLGAAHALHVLYQTCRTLYDVMRTTGDTHCDVKAENIMLHSDASSALDARLGDWEEPLLITPLAAEVDGGMAALEQLDDSPATMHIRQGDHAHTSMNAGIEQMLHVLRSKAPPADFTEALHWHQWKSLPAQQQQEILLPVKGQFVPYVTRRTDSAGVGKALEWVVGMSPIAVALGLGAGWSGVSPDVREKAAQLAADCCEAVPSRRPAMSEVIRRLGQLLAAAGV